MHLLVIRHGIAEDQIAFALTGEIDDRRPLTDRGRTLMRRGARGLRVIAPRIDLLASSPYLRAMETAAIVSRVYDGMPVQPTTVLTPDQKPEAALEWLHGCAGEVVAVVGHEPHLTRLVTWLLAKRGDPLLTLKKGSACLLRLDGELERASAVLEWSLTPAHLRRLRRRWL